MTDFLILGPETAVRKDNIFPLIRDGVVDYGYRRDRVHIMFMVPGFDGLVDISYVRWFTSLGGPDMPPLVLKKSVKDGYRKYDGTDIINVDDYRDIPGDWEGLIGVPICFINRLCRDQFEIVDKKEDGVIDGESRYTRLIIRRK